MRLHKKIMTFVFISLLAVTGIAANVYANLSITDLHDTQEKKELYIFPESTDESNTASLLSQVGIYTNQAISDQYKTTDKDGNLIPTKMSDLIDAASSILTETDENGKSIVEPIPTVSEILSYINEKPSQEYEKEYGYNPDDLDQLTYMMDFKYISTDYRVIAGEKITVENKVKRLDNGMIRVSIKGDEILRSSSKEDFVIVQVDPVTNNIYLFEMTEYDVKTGDYTADFPCVGPYMITQIMR